MINNLSKLAARSILLFKKIGQQENTKIIDDKILNIIPTDEKIFQETNNRNKISFKPFYTEILNLFSKEEIIPTIDGYTSKQSAYIAESGKLINLFSNEQLAFLSNDPKAKWAFTSIEFHDNSNWFIQNTITLYVKQITRACLNDESFLIENESKFTSKPFGITANFIENQSFEWLHKFYKWINDSQQRTQLCVKLPIFLDKDKKALAAFNKAGKLQLYLPFEGNTFYRTINEELIKNKMTLNFLSKIGITKPSFKDEITNVIIPKYMKKDAIIDTVPDFKKIFAFYKECSQKEMNSFISLVKKIDFLMGFSKNKNGLFRCCAQFLYFPSNFLFEYFENNQSVLFINLDFYKNIVDEKDLKMLIDFLTKMGVSKEVKLVQVEIPQNIASMFIKTVPYYTRYIKFVECRPDGFDQLFESIKTNKEKSIVLWNYLLSICKKDSIKNLEILRCDYFYYTSRYENFISIIKTKLQTEKWILNSKNELVSPKEIFPIELKIHYDVKSPEYPVLLKFLEIKDKIVNENFTKEQQDDLELIHELRENNLIDEVTSLLTMKKCKKLQNRSIKTDVDEDEEDFENDNHYTDKKTNHKSSKKESIKTKKNEKDDEDDIKISSIKERSIKMNDFDDDSDDDELNMKTLNLYSKYANRVAKKILPSSNLELPKNQDDNINVDDDDEDFIQPSRKHFNKKRIISDMIKNKTEIENMLKMEKLQLTAEKSTKYSFLWFKTLLQMELTESNYNNSINKSISIVFSKVELEKGTTRTLILKHPNRYIPLYMEELSNIPLKLYLCRSTKMISIEVINVQSYAIRAKFKSPSELEGVDLNLITEAVINATNPVFLLEELWKSFAALKFDDDFNMLDNLCQNIDFIFGPPGTGKTTHLVQNVIIPLMIKQNDDKELNENDASSKLKVLVLTPTNKAANVVVKRIIECMKEDLSYKNWLIRFGTESEEATENLFVHRDKSFDIEKLRKNVTVTTIHRFCYDFFKPDDKTKIYLKDIEWDFIIFDEASMIPLISIIYPLYKQTPKKFIVAGDPFQIQPITTVDLWKNENIYTLVELNSFTDAKTRPHQYHIELLTTQYRSVPSVGNIYSKFTYGGILKHNRSEDSIKKIKIEGFDFSTLNIIKYPVNNFESIYKPRKLQNMSSYHIYCSLFVFEFIKFLSQQLTIKNNGEKFSIGIIAAYRAQTDLIDKLFSSYQLPENIDLQIGTIHGFQGDECDIVFAVFNPPPKISSSSEMFLNNKNIINVSISRTRDYLFVLMPDNKTENVNMLKYVKKVEKLCKQDDYSEFDSHDLEKLIYGDDKYIENNSFATSHQLVNVYFNADKKYEIRCDEKAIDIFMK